MYPRLTSSLEKKAGQTEKNILGKAVNDIFWRLGSGAWCEECGLYTLRLELTADQGYPDLIAYMQDFIIDLWGNAKDHAWLG